MRTLCAWLALSWAAAVAAGAGLPETPQFRTLGVGDGLPSSAVNAIAQDREGYLWFATRDGLARYDGVAFQLHRHVPGDPAALPGNVVQALHIDAADRIWVGIEGAGLSVMGPDRRGFRHYRRATHPAMASDEVWAITSRADGSLWFGTFGGGLHRLDGETLRQYSHDPDRSDSLPDDNVLALAADPAGQLWVGTTAGLARWTGEGFERVPVASLSGPVVFSLSPDPDGSLWIGTNAGLDRRDPGGGIAPAPWRAHLSEPGVTALVRDRQGTRWIATRRGLDRERDGEIRGPEEGDEGRFSLLAAFEDREGGLWFGSADRGVLRLPPTWRHFSVLRHRRDDPGALGNAVVRGIADAGPGRVWLVGGSRALDRVELASGRVERVLEGESAFPDRRLWSVLQRRDGSVWIGHYAGLTRLDPATRATRHWAIGAGEDALLPGPVTLLAESGDGLLWLASLGGGVQARDGSGRVVHSLVPGDGQGLEAPDPEQLLVGPDGLLWLAGAQGLQRWNPTSARLERVPGSPPDRVFGLVFVASDQLWLHRLGGLESYRLDNGRLQRLRAIGDEAGFPTVESGGLVVDGGGVLWLTTPRGLVRYDPTASSLRQFGVRDGLPSQEFDRQPPLMSAGGIGVAATVAGLVLFDPSRIRAESGKPSLVVSRLSVRRGEQEVELPHAGELRLGPADRELRVSVRLLAYADPPSHRYRFRLQGHDADWVETGALGERVFSRLAPGEYQLDVRAGDADGAWSAPQRFTVIVDPPWWQTGWALAAAAVLAALALLAAGGAYRQRLKRRLAWQLGEQARQLAEQASEAKSRFLANLGHEIRTPMTGVLGMSELLLGGDLPPRQRGQVESIQRAGQHLLRLVNDALDLARIEAGKLVLDEAPFDLHRLLDEVSDLLRPLAEAKGLQFATTRAPGTPQWLRGDAGRVRQILLNLGSNAIKFCGQGRVDVDAGPRAPLGIVLEVRDTGPGLSPEQQSRLFQRFEQAEGGRTTARHGGSGLGLAICQELAVAMDGRIDVESALGAGAVFRVCLPLAACEPGPAASASAAPVAAIGPGRRRLLLVEDDPTVADVVCGLLRARGHEVVHAAQALAALAELAGSRFDAAIVDLDLPGLDGLQLARLLRSQGQDLPLLALTARADGEAEPEAMAAGMTGFLRKPVTGDLLEDALSRLPLS